MTNTKSYTLRPLTRFIQIKENPKRALNKGLYRMARPVWWKWAIPGTIIFILAATIVTYAVLSIDFNRLKPAIATVVKEATGRDLAMGQFDLQIGFTPRIVVENLAFENPKWAHRRYLARIRRLEIYVELLPLFFQKMAIKRLVLVEPDVQLEIGKSGLSNFDFNPSGREKRSATSSLKLTELPRFTFQEILFKNVRFSLRRADSKTLLTILLESFEATTRGPDAPIRLRLKGSFRERAFVVQAVTGSLEQLLKQDEPWPLATTIEALGVHSSLRGSIADLARIKGVNLSLTAEGETTKGIGDLLNVEPIARMGAFKLAAKVSCPELGIYRISDLRLNTNGMEVSSSFHVHTGGKRPSVRGILVSQDLDFTRFFHRAEIVSEKQQRETVFSDKTLRADILGALDGEFRIRAKRIVTPYGLMENVQMDAFLRGSRLALKFLKATIGGGVAEGQAVCRAEGNNFALSGAIKIDDLELSRLLKDLRKNDVVGGTVEGEAEFSTFGNSVRSLMANLNGKSIVTVGRGRIKNHFMQVPGGEIKASILSLFGASKGGADYTDVDCAVCGLDIREGLARVTALVVDTSETTVRGSGEVDLKTERVDLSLEPLPKRGVAGLSLSLGELAKPFKVSGTLANPSLGIDPTRTALTIGKAIAGVVLLGPLGIAGALAGRTSEQDPCGAALQAARKESKAGDTERARDPLGRDAQAGH